MNPNKDELYHYYGGLSLNSYQDELYHFGVKGMKWGRRKQIIRGVKKQARAQHMSRGERKAMIKNALAKDTASRVQRYGGRKVLRANRWRRRFSAAGRIAALGALEGVAKKYNKGSIGRVLARTAQAGIIIGSVKRNIATRTDDRRAWKYIDSKTKTKKKKKKK